MAMTRGFSRIILVKYSVGSLAHRKYLMLALVTGSSYKLEAIVGHGIGLLPGLQTAVWGKRLPSAAQCCSTGQGRLGFFICQKGIILPLKAEERNKRAYIMNFTQYLAPSWGSVKSSSYYNTYEGIWEIKMLHKLNILLLVLLYLLHRSSIRA